MFYFDEKIFIFCIIWTVIVMVILVPSIYSIYQKEYDFLVLCVIVNFPLLIMFFVLWITFFNITIEGKIEECRRVISVELDNIEYYESLIKSDYIVGFRN